MLPGRGDRSGGRVRSDRVGSRRRKIGRRLGARGRLSADDERLARARAGHRGTLRATQPIDLDQHPRRAVIQEMIGGLNFSDSRRLGLSQVDASHLEIGPGRIDQGGYVAPLLDDLFVFACRLRRGRAFRRGLPRHGDASCWRRPDAVVCTGCSNQRTEQGRRRPSDGSECVAQFSFLLQSFRAEVLKSGALGGNRFMGHSEVSLALAAPEQPKLGAHDTRLGRFDSPVIVKAHTRRQSNDCGINV